MPGLVIKVYTSLQIIKLKYKIDLLDLFYYREDILLYIYFFSTEKTNNLQKGFLFFNKYKNGKCQNKDIILDTYEEGNFNSNYNIFNYEQNKVLVIGNKTIYIIDVSLCQLITNINIKNSKINFCYSFLNSYYILFLENDLDDESYECLFEESEENENNLMVIKIDEKFNQFNYKTIYKNQFMTEEEEYLFFKNINNKKKVILSIKDTEINFYEIINMKISKTFIFDFK